MLGAAEQVDNASRRRHVPPPIRTFTVGTGIPPVQPGAPDLSIECAQLADCNRRFGITPTPEHVCRIDCKSTRGRPSYSRVVASQAARVSMRARAVPSSTIRSVMSPAASAPRRLAIFEPARDDAHAAGRAAQHREVGPGRAFVQRDAVGRAVGAVEHGGDVADDPVAAERLEVGALEVPALVDVARHLGERANRGRTRRRPCAPAGASSRRVDRSRQNARLVSGSSKNAGTGNCCTCAPNASPKRRSSSLA